MVGSKVLLILFGTTIASCHFLRNALNGNGLNHVPLVYSTPDGPSQFMTHLLPSGGNILYKPQFIIPPMIERLMRAKIDCVKDGLEHYLPVIPDTVVQKPVHPKQFTVIVPPESEVVIENKPIQIPEPPVLPPFTMPELPIFVEEPKTKIDCEKDGLKHYVPVIPDVVVQEPVHPKEFTIIVPPEPEVVIENKPIQIPEPPVLPPFTLPELPIFVEEPKTKIDCEKDGLKHYVPVIPDVVVQEPVHPKEFTVIVPPEPEVVIENKPIQIPEPPVLPPFTMPELPIFVEEPKTKIDCEKDGLKHYVPVIPDVVVQEPEHPKKFTVIVPSEPEVVIENKPIQIPEPPVLPPFTMPELPIFVEEPKTSAPATEQNNQEKKDNCKPLEIPVPPVLPIMPELPIPQIVDIFPNDFPTVPVISGFEPLPAPEFIPVEIPEPPTLPPISIPELPVPIFTEVIPENKPVIIPESPILPPLPNDCVSDLNLSEVPEGPTLPPFVLPPLPEIVVEEKRPEVNELPSKPENAPNNCIYDVPETVPLPNFVEAPQIIEVPILPETSPLILQVPQHPSVTEVIPEPCDNKERVPENKPILILEQMHPVTGVTTQEIVPEVMELNVGGTKVTIPSLGSLSFPNFCVQNLIIDRALPSMIIGEKYYAKNMASYIAGQHSILPMFQYYKR